jgi:hypothetical protein
MKDSKRISAEVDNNQVKVIPQRFGGTTGANKGYHDIEDRIIYSSFDTQELGQKIMQAFALCE